MEHGCADCCSQLAEAKGQIGEMTRIMADQARTIANLTGRGTGETSTITVNEIYERFEAAHKSKPSWRVKRNRLRPFLRLFGPLPAMGLTVPMWAAFRERRKVDDPLLGKAIAPVTINFRLGWVKTMFAWASDDEQVLIPTSPLARAKREKTDTARETWLTEHDIQQLLERCGSVLTAFVLIAVDTGLRLSEVLKIRHDRIRRGETEGGEPIGVIEFSKRQMKGKHGHMAALTPRALAAIDSIQVPSNPFVLPSPYRPGRHYGARHIERMFRAACKASGIDVRAAEGDIQIRVHDLRHSAATAATRRGASLLQVQRMLNHSTPAITARYVHHDEGGVIALAALMDEGAKKKGGDRRIAHRRWA